MDRRRVYEGHEPYMFVSYAHKDSDRVLPIISTLQERGFRVWYDAGIEAGTEWPEYIAEHLNGCAVFVAFISDAAMQSQNCCREINLAIELSKQQLAVYMEDVHLSLGMRMQLGTLQALHRSRHSSRESFLDELCNCRLLRVCRSENERSAMAQVSQEEIEAWFEKAETLNLNCREEEAVKWYRKAAEQGHPDAQNALGICYLYGQGVPEDKNEGEYWCSLAEEQYRKLIEQYRKAAELGDADAQYQLAICYDVGKGVPSDNDEASKWYRNAAEQYRKAAEQGSADAQYKLGNCYSFGEGVSEDYEEAAKWYRKAAEQGHAGAQRSLAGYYSYGFGVPMDMMEAVKWYHMAAEQGDATAQCELGYFYQSRSDTPEDLEEAVKWYRKAAQQQEVRAEDELRKLGYSG